MERDPNRRTLNIEQACKEVGVTRRTIYNWINAGRLEVIRTAGGAIRIYSDTLFQTMDKKVVS